jgi:hypothetical protein
MIRKVLSSFSKTKLERYLVDLDFVRAHQERPNIFTIGLRSRNTSQVNHAARNDVSHLGGKNILV